MFLRLPLVVALHFPCLIFIQGCAVYEPDLSRPTFEDRQAMSRMSQQQFFEFLRAWQEQNEPVQYSYPLEPPWKFAPEYPMVSMGWRMGSGEDYWFLFHDWFKELPVSDRQAYMQENPEPEGWTGFYNKFGDVNG